MSYLQKAIINYLNGSNKEVVKLYPIRETFIPGDDTNLRIQVRPQYIKENLHLGNFSRLFGSVEVENNKIFVEFDISNVMNSNAVNKSLYICRDSLDKFINGVTNDNFYDETIFNEKFRKFDEDKY